MANYEQILTDVEHQVLTITLNRPDRLNAWTGQMQLEVQDAIEKAGKDDTIRCIVVTGAGRGFCAGADMSARRRTGRSEKGRSAQRALSQARWTICTGSSRIPRYG